MDRDTVTVGDVVRLTVRMRAPLGATVNFPTGLDSLAPVQALEPPAVSNGADSTVVDRSRDVSALAVGHRPPADPARRRGGADRTTATAAWCSTLPTLFVKSVLPADSAQRVPKPARPLLERACADTVVVVGARGRLPRSRSACCVWWWIRRRRRVATADGRSVRRRGGGVRAHRAAAACRRGRVGPARCADDRRRAALSRRASRGGDARAHQRRAARRRCAACRRCRSSGCGDCSTRSIR